MGSYFNLLRRHWRSLFILFTLLCDASVITTTFFLAIPVRRLIPHSAELHASNVVWVLPFLIAGLTFFGLVLGVYRSAYHSDLRQQYLLAGKSYLFSIAGTLALFYLFQEGGSLRRLTLLFFLMLPVVFLLGRYALNQLNQYMQRQGYGIHNAIIVGYEDGGMDVFERFSGFPELGYQVRGIVTKKATEKIKRGPLPHYTMTKLAEVVRKEKIDRAFIPSPKFITNGYSELIEVCRKQRIKLKVLSPEADQLLQTARVFDIAGITLYSPPRGFIDSFRKTVKRLFDIIGSVILILLFSPIFAATAAAIFIESRGPVFFKQRRAATKGGKVFHFYKFRSMVKNADEMKQGLFRLNESDGALFKIKNDPRMTIVGSFIRRYSIDELPQLFNVLKGDMSLVGPRPLPICDFDQVNEGAEFWDAIRDRGKLKPGMTGLWQVSGRSAIRFKEMVLLDLYYIENQSLLFDLEIMFATIPVVLFGKGAY